MSSALLKSDISSCRRSAARNGHSRLPAFPSIRRSLIHDRQDAGLRIHFHLGAIRYSRGNVFIKPGEH